jgi:hypothetical protein
MAKKRRKNKGKRVAGLRISPSLVAAALQAANTPMGRVLIAEGLVFLAGILVRRNAHTLAAAAEAGGDAAGAVGQGAAAGTQAAKEALGDVAAKVMHAAADWLRGSAGLDLGGETGSGGARKSRVTGPEGRRSDTLDEDLIRKAVLGEFSRKTRTKKAKQAKRH